MFHGPMASCCNICVDPTCGGKRNCNCNNCVKKDSCYRFAGLKPTVRITRKCTQSCGHCCFECSPKATEMMTLEMSRKVNVFCTNNNIRQMEVMGGEFFCHPKWNEILHTLTDGIKKVRLVSNGDWAGSEVVAMKVISFLKTHSQFHVGISRDQWHTNQYVDQALKYLQDANIPVRLPSPEEIKEDSIVPIGNGELYFGFYSMLGNYCNKPERRYSFLIDEEGNIHKCGFGVWPYAKVEEYLDGGFDKRFKEFNDKFYGCFIMTCSQCRRAESYSKKRLTTEEKSV